MKSLLLALALSLPLLMLPAPRPATPLAGFTVNTSGQLAFGDSILAQRWLYAAKRAEFLRIQEPAGSFYHPPPGECCMAPPHAGNPNCRELHAHSVTRVRTAKQEPAPGVFCSTTHPEEDKRCHCMEWDQGKGCKDGKRHQEMGMNRSICSSFCRINQCTCCRS